VEVTGPLPSTSRQVSTVSGEPWRTKHSCSTRLPSGSAKVHRGHGSVAKAAIRAAPSGCVTSGA
jgi:hypothetical protein